MVKMDKETAIADLARVREMFAEWRRTRTKRGPIPSDLWGETSQLLEVLPFSKVQRELQLNYASFKKRIASFPQKSSGGKRFVELKLPVPHILGEKVLAEIIRPDGLRIRFFSSEASPLLREFLGT